MAGMPVFGRMAPQSVANDVMQSPSLNAMPSPPDPLELPNDELVAEYARLLHSAYKLRQIEKDPFAQGEVEHVVRFGEDRLDAIVGSNEWRGAPAATPMPPMGGMAPPAAGTPGPPPPPQMAMAGAGSPPATGGSPA